MFKPELGPGCFLLSCTHTWSFRCAARSPAPLRACTLPRLTHVSCAYDATYYLDPDDRDDPFPVGPFPSDGGKVRLHPAH